MTLQGKTGLITGASRGIGRAIALAFAREGANVAVIYAGSQQAAQHVCAQAAEYGVQARAYQCDVADFDQVKETVQAVQKDLGGVDILVNNAGITRDGLVYTMKEADFDAVLDTNLKGAFHLIKHCYPIFVKKRAGKIINISSVWGSVGASCEAVYSAAKGGVNAFTKALAKELGPSSIQVNAIACGLIQTHMNSTLSPKEQQDIIDEIPACRMGRPEEVAELIFALATGHDYLTGQIITLDGGWI